MFAQPAKHKSAFLVDTNLDPNSILSRGLGLEYVQDEGFLAAQPDHHTVTIA